MDYYKPGALKQLKFTLSPFWRTEPSQHHSAKTCSPFSGSRGASVTCLWFLVATSLWSSRPASLHLSLLCLHVTFCLCHTSFCLHIETRGDFLGGPVAKTPRCQCRGPGFNPWSGN